MLAGGDAAGCAAGGCRAAGIVAPTRINRAATAADRANTRQSYIRTLAMAVRRRAVKNC